MMITFLAAVATLAIVTWMSASGGWLFRDGISRHEAEPKAGRIQQIEHDTEQHLQDLMRTTTNQMFAEVRKHESYSHG
jgi:hypothetical protein